MVSGFIFEEMTQSGTQHFSSHLIGSNAASRDVPSCKEVWEMQTLVGQPSAYLKLRSSATKGKSKGLGTGDKQLTLSQAVFSLVISLVLTIT